MPLYRYSTTEKNPDAKGNIYCTLERKTNLFFKILFLIKQKIRRLENINLKELRVIQFYIEVYELLIILIVLLYQFALKRKQQKQQQKCQKLQNSFG